jgi:hypothetical protein
MVDTFLFDLIWAKLIVRKRKSRRRVLWLVEKSCSILHSSIFSVFAVSGACALSLD